MDADVRGSGSKVYRLRSKVEDEDKRRERGEERGDPLDPPWDPLHPLHVGKYESELRFYPLHYPLQAATEPLHTDVECYPARATCGSRRAVVAICKDRVGVRTVEHAFDSKYHRLLIFGGPFGK